MSPILTPFSLYSDTRFYRLSYLYFWRQYTGVVASLITDSKVIQSLLLKSTALRLERFELSRLLGRPEKIA